ncbi:MAG TPA: Rrf2 family transcriptional regulator [Acetobacteraceae bacterium]|nr:Rrf2 family transcriptional regulator [Acetobacteraceae bacterium]
MKPSPVSASTQPWGDRGRRPRLDARPDAREETRQADPRLAARTGPCAKGDPLLSSKAKYALRAALRLAEEAGGGRWVQASEIAETGVIPRKFLEAILVELRDHHVIESRRGPHGGHRLTRPPAEISVADIIRIVDGPLALTPCASRTQFRACADCVDVRSCALRFLMQEARDAVSGVLDGCSLADLLQQAPAEPPRSEPGPARPSDSGVRRLPIA